MVAGLRHQSWATGSDMGQSRSSGALGDSSVRKTSLQPSTTTKALRNRLWRMSMRPASPSDRAAAWPAPQASAISSMSQAATARRPMTRCGSPVPGMAAASRRRGPRVRRRSRAKTPKVTTTITPTLSAASPIRDQSSAWAAAA